METGRQGTLGPLTFTAPSTVELPAVAIDSLIEDAATPFINMICEILARGSRCIVLLARCCQYCMRPVCEVHHQAHKGPLVTVTRLEDKGYLRVTRLPQHVGGESPRV